MTRKQYLRHVLQLYRLLPDTPDRVHKGDRTIVNQLFERNVPIRTIEAALLLGTARRACRDPLLPQLEPIRSLAYFLPILRQIPTTQPPDGYLDYLRRTIHIQAARSKPDLRSQRSAVSRNR